MSDARDRLRRYLEQRREMGESEFVLDSLSVDDALKVLSFGATPPSTTATNTTPTSAAGRGEAERAPSPPDSAMRRAANEAAKGGDWRTALRAIDGEIETPATPTPKPAPKATPSSEPVAPMPSTGAGGSIHVGTDAERTELAHLRSLEDVAAAISKCVACELSATAINHVPGEGNPQAKFVIVGEAPGATEDQQGRPFVGRSGDLLAKILEAIGFKREDVFICNVLKHRPPANRDPTKVEIAACRPFLLRQLEILEPKVILTLGTFAARTLLGTDSPIGKLRGIEHRYHGIPLIATYHPAALLRNPNWKRPTWEDVQLARRIFDRP